jgi:hypothetical protein
MFFSSQHEERPSLFLMRLAAIVSLRHGLHNNSVDDLILHITRRAWKFFDVVFCRFRFLCT